MNPTTHQQSEQTLVLGSAAAVLPNASEHEFLPTGTQLHEFEITGLVGEGGFGVVYLAYDHLLQRRIALKEYLPVTLAVRGRGQKITLRSQHHAETFAKGLQSFINEARLLARFDHPALVKVHRFWQANGTAYLVMPYYDGPTLKAARLAMPEPPSEDWIRRLLAPLLDALELIHCQDCLHRDIAPDNILLVAEKPVLLDFGAARRVIGDMTQAMTVILKPGYAPVEQYAEMPGIRQGPWTDLYALGAVLHFLTTGQAPPPSVGRMMQASHVAPAARAEGRYSASLLDAIERCLAIRVEDRPQSVAQLRELLGPDPAAGIASGASPAGGDRPPPVPPRRAPRRIWPPLAATAILLGGWLLHESESETPVPDFTPTVQDAAPRMPASSAEPVVKVAQDLESAWHAVTQTSSADYELAVSDLRNPLHVGRDSLELQLSSTRDGWLYLLLWDRANDHVGLLLPNSVDADNRIKSGEALTLPRPSWRYVADAPAGTWEILLLVSESPRDFSALGLDNDGMMLSASRERVEQMLANSGPSALSGVPKCSTDVNCPTGYGALRLTLQELGTP